MIGHLDNLIRHLLMKEVRSLMTQDANTGNIFQVEEKQIGFRPPDENWRAYVSTLTVNNIPADALNVYLVDLKENRKLRSNEIVRGFDNGNITETPAPQRMDCHYLVTAWSPAIINPANDETVDDEYIRLHFLINEGVAVLMKNAPLVPRLIYTPNPVPPGLNEDEQLPIVVLPVEGFPKLAEFWGTMGTNHRWLPAIYAIITLPVVLDAEIAGPMVTARITEYRHSGKSETAEVWIQIGGIVTNPAGEPVESAWVRLETTTGEPLQTTYTKKEEGEMGQYTFAKLKEGTYKLRVRAPGFTENLLSIEVPSPTGNYDIQLT